MGSGAKSYVRKGFLIYEEMRKFFPIYEKVVSLNFLIYEENFLLFLSVHKLSGASIHTVLILGYSM
jgi:hypothetical protein